MYKNVLILVIIGFLLLSCDPTDDKKVAEAEIANIIRELEYTFNNTVQGGNDVTSIMRYYSDNYRHNGADKTQVANRWVTRAREYSSMNTDIINIIVYERDATVILTTYFYPRGNNNRPELDIYNDFSVFYDDDDGWKIFGNQLNISIDNQ